MSFLEFWEIVGMAAILVFYCCISYMFMSAVKYTEDIKRPVIRLFKKEKGPGFSLWKNIVFVAIISIVDYVAIANVEMTASLIITATSVGILVGFMDVQKYLLREGKRN